jgi:hypothetical protein
MRSWIPWAMTFSTEQRMRSRRPQARKAGRQLLGQHITEISLARIAREIEDGKIAMGRRRFGAPQRSPASFSADIATATLRFGGVCPQQAGCWPTMRPD